ncbi:MAG: threonine/serine dehydratase [Candidatus Obscuribacterales bacterium]
MTSAKPMNTGAKLTEVIRPTTFVESPRLSKQLGVVLTFASETFQITGSFKFRAAYNLAANVPETEIITASSGNFGQALAYACTLLGKRATIVMPETSAQVKIDAVREFGGIVELVDTRKTQRAEKVRELAQANPRARVASAYDEDLVIEGNASLGHEIAGRGDFDCVIVPVGGGGLIAGVVTGIRRAGNQTTAVIGAEPQLANDASRSLQSGNIVRMETEPPTIADGARTISLGNANWEVIRREIHEIIEVPDDQIKSAVRLAFTHANLKTEPTGALSLGALVANRKRFAGQKVLCVVSGGNVDPAVYQAILSEADRG